ncbi:MAG: cytochrome C biogenesis protein [Synergistaceae bacterium]|nr:cytochrome C biogenesis protein [Synergistaceae bacterium]
MLSKIFDFMFSSGATQFFGAFLWGIASVLLSPCGIGIIPLVVSYIENTDNPTRSRAFKISCAFCLGIIFNLMLVALITSGLGMLLGGYERFLTLFVSVVFIVMGLHLTGIIHVKLFSFSSGAKGTESQSLKGAIILGIVSGLAVGPCSIAYVSPILSLAMSLASESGSFIVPVMLILAYALGYSLVIILAGTFAQIFAGYLQSERGDKVLKCVNVLCGLGLIAAGLYFLYEMYYLL